MKPIPEPELTTRRGLFLRSVTDLERMTRAELAVFMECFASSRERFRVKAVGQPFASLRLDRARRRWKNWRRTAWPAVGLRWLWHLTTAGDGA